MRLLLDTNALLWAILAKATLSRTAFALIADEENEIFISAASAWEIATKVRIGKLPGAEAFEERFLETIEKAGYALLSVDAGCALRAGRLVGEHRDPFDRMIAAHALGERYPRRKPRQTIGHVRCPPHLVEE